MESLLLRYGYALTFLGVAFEGEAVLFASVLLAQRGFFRLPVVIAVAVAANSLADQAHFQLARLRGRAWLERRFGRHPRYQRLTGLVGRRGGLLLLVLGR
jgi:membrane protein DedA with SNARE-associated domain